MALFDMLGLFKHRPAIEGWRPPFSLDQGAIGRACCAMHRNGLGQATWENHGRLWTQTFAPGSGVSPVCLPLGPGRDPRMAVNLDGSGMVAWLLDGPEGSTLIGLPVAAGRVPDTTRSLFRTAGAIHHLQLAADRRGGALVVWTHEHQGEFEVLATHFDIRAKAWDAEPARLGPKRKHLVEPRLAMNRRGQAVVAWSETALGAEGLMACYFFPSMRQWSDRPVPVAPGLIQSFQLGLDHAGSLLVLLVRQEYGQRARLEARLHSAATSTWLPAETLATAWRFDQIQLALAGSGEALAAWLQGEGTAAGHLHARGFRPGGWEERATRLEPEQGVVEQFALALGPRGLASVLSIVQHHGDRVPVVHDRDHGWSGPTAVGVRIGEAMDGPMVSVSNRGGLALWRAGEGERCRLRLAQRSAGGT